MACHICSSENKLIFKHTILDKHEVSYFKCEKCGFIQTEEPYWLDEAYTNAINASDTGIYQRNTVFSDLVLATSFFLFGKKIKILDFAGGHGLLVRMLRDIGINCFWDDKYAENIFARGFEYNDKMKIDLITAFEVFEHLPDPISEINQMLQISNSILFSTKTLPQSIPDENWGYYGFNHGQHVAFYAQQTLRYIAKQNNLNFYSDGKAIHLITSKKLNTLFVKILFKVSKIKLFSFLKVFYSSFTMSDHELLKKNMQ